MPEYDPDDYWLLSSFYDLSTCRMSGMVIGPIPYTAIVDYIRFWGIDSVSAKLLIEVVRALDTVYMKHVNSKKK